MQRIYWMHRTRFLGLFVLLPSLMISSSSTMICASLDETREVSSTVSTPVAGPKIAHLVVGVPYEDIGTNADAGLDNIIAGDFDSDGYDDLAIGIPREDVQTVATELEDAGAVQILYGSPGGLGYNGSWTFPQTNAEIAESGYFGASLVIGYFNDDAFADLAVGSF